jgi:Ca2+-binding RTX toxin-like protein
MTINSSSYQDLLNDWNFTGTPSGTSAIFGGAVPSISGKYQVSYSFFTSQNQVELSYYGGDALAESFATNYITTVENAFRSIFESPAQASGYRTWFQDVSNITFTTPSSGEGLIAVGQSNTNIDPIDRDPFDNSSVSAFTYVFEDNLSPDGLQYGDIWINSEHGGNVWLMDPIISPGTAAFKIVLEELMHSLGVDILESDPLTSLTTIRALEFNSHKYTVTSYFDHPDMVFGGNVGPYPGGLQILDIAALQAIYGANTSIRNEDSDGNALTTGTTYGIGQGFGATASDAFVYTIWDGGGSTDAIDATGYQTGVEIDLREGHFSSIGDRGNGQAVAFDSGEYDAGNVAIAFGTVIEHAIGTNQNDILRGNAAGNDLQGMDGNDVLIGDAGNDTLTGGMGNDTYYIDLSVRSGIDTIIEGAIAGTADTIKFVNAEGLSIGDLGFVYDTNSLAMSLGDYTVYLPFLEEAKVWGNVRTTFIEYIEINGQSYDLNKLLPFFSIQINPPGGAVVTHQGGTGNDIITGSSGNDVIDGSSGNDTLNGGSGNDYIIGSWGDDIYYASGGNDIISDRSENSGTLLAGYDKVYINHNSDDVNIFGMDGGRDLLFEMPDGSTLILDGQYTDLPNRTIVTVIEEVIFIDKILYLSVVPDGLTSSSRFTSGAGYGRGFYTTGSLTTPTILGSYDDRIYASSTGPQFIHAGDGDDVVYSHFGMDNLRGGAGNDFLHGGSSNDTLDGGAGDDHLYGETGDDLLVDISGGLNIHDGGSGNDTYYLQHSGMTTIKDSIGSDTLRMEFYGANIDASQIRLVSTLDVDDIIVAVGSYNLTYIEDFYNNTIETFRFRDPASYTFTSYDKNWVISNISFGGLAGSNAADNITLTSAQAYYGLGGNDAITGSASVDTLYGGTGNDVLNGGAGADSMFGEIGHDVYFVDAGDAVADNGTSDNDLYLVSAAATGSYTISDNGGGNDAIYVTLLIGQTYGFSTDGASLFINLISGSDTSTITIASQYGAGANALVERIMFGSFAGDVNSYDGSYTHSGGFIMTANGLSQTLSFTVAGETINGSSDTLVADLIYANGGNDVVYANAGADTVYGGDGNDYAYGEDGNDTLYGDAGDDVLSGQDGNDVLWGGAGVDYLWGNTGNDTLYGEAGADALRGLEGNDTIYGGDDNDNIRGDDVDSASNFSGAGYDELHGGNGNDNIAGGSGNDILYGDAGQDTLWGNAEADTFVFDTSSNAMDYVMDFDAQAGGDILDISGVFNESYDVVASLSSFVQLQALSAHTRVQVDRDGSGSAFGWENVAQLQGLTGLNLSTLQSNGALIVD